MEGVQEKEGCWLGILNPLTWDFPSGPVIRTPGSPMQGAPVQAHWGTMPHNRAKKVNPLTPNTGSVLTTRSAGTLMRPVAQSKAT